jgi:hypothetical protein
MRIGKLNLSAETQKTPVFELGFFCTGGKNLIGIYCGVFGFKFGRREIVIYWLIEK